MKPSRIILLLLVALCLWLYLRTMDFSTVIPALQQVGTRFTWLIAITFIAYFCGTIGWKYCLLNDWNRLSTFRLFLVRHAGETVGMINPAGALGGEAAKLYLLRNSGLDKENVLASLVSSRAIMMMAHVVLFIPVIGYLLLTEPGFRSHILVPQQTVYIFAAAISLIVIACLLISRITKRPGNAFPQWFNRLANQFKEVPAALSRMAKYHRKEISCSFLFFALHWIIGSLEFYAILTFLHTEPTVLQALAVDLGVTFFKLAGTAVPGQIGIEEYANKIMLGLMGINGDDTWITASLLRRLRQIIWILTGALLFLIITRWNIRVNTATHGDPVRQP